MLRFNDGYVDEDKPLVVLVLYTYRFLFVQSGSEEVHPDVQLFGNFLKLVFCRICEMYPAAGSHLFAFKDFSG